MTNDWNEFEREDGRFADDQVLPAVVQWDLGGARGYAGETVWQCDATRAGKLYSRSLFGSQAEAEAFVARMKQTEPDQMFSVEAVKTSAMWN
jgi:hypothetical protein